MTDSSAPSIICAACHTQIEPHATVCSACQADPLIQGRFALQRVLGAGAAGTTYLALDRQSDQLVAIKELSIRSLHSFKVLELFEREVSVLRSIEHPGIPRYLAHFDETDGKYVSMYLVQEYIEGHTLEQERQHKRFGELEVIDVIRQLSLILVDLHQSHPPIIHRDIKLKNIMRRPNGRLVLIDFGSVREAMRDVGGSTVAGTFGYMAPEQFAGMAQPSSDLYGLGVVAVALLSRKDPHEMLDVGNQLIWRPHLPPINPHLMTLLERMLEPDVHQRITSAQAVVDWIEKPQHHTQHPTTTSSLPEQVFEVLRQRFMQMHRHVPMDQMMLERLRNTAELASVILNTDDRVDIDLPFFAATAAGPIHYQTVLFREELRQTAMVHQPRQNYPIVKSSGAKKMAIPLLIFVAFTVLSTILPILFAIFMILFM